MEWVGIDIDICYRSILPTSERTSLLSIRQPNTSASFDSQASNPSYMLQISIPQVLQNYQ